MLSPERRERYVFNAAASSPTPTRHDGILEIHSLLAILKEHDDRYQLTPVRARSEDCETACLAGQGL
jgi:hypothetical protein